MDATDADIMNTSVSATRMDDLELEAVGYAPAMPRQFSLLSLVALSFTLTCTWLGTGASIGTGLAEASAAGALWSLLVAGVMTLILSTGMAELASAFPVAGAQYYWSFMVASEKHRAFASYLNGWLSILGWWLASGSVANFLASMILAIVSVWYPNYEQQRWHIYLIYVGLMWLSVAVIIFGAAYLPYFNKAIFVLSVTTFAATMISLFVVGRHDHAPASFIFTDTQSVTGWSSYGFAFLLAVINATFGYLGTDCAAHLAEEISNPSQNIPKCIIYPVLMGLGTAFPFAAALLYSITDLSAILSSTTLPLIDIYAAATGSDAAASVLLAAFSVCFFGCLVGVGTTCSRTIWAVSRDGALPFSSIWVHIHPTYNMPANASILSGVCVTLYGLLFLGSTTAFAAMVSTTVLFLQTSCVMPQAILLFRGREVLPERYFSLGKWGPVVNAIAVVWITIVDVLACFPVFLPVTPQNMSYVVVVTVGLLAIVIILWFTLKRGVYVGPRVNLELMHERRRAALHRGTPVLDGRGEVEAAWSGSMAETESVSGRKFN